jgi:hypothetical protein
MNPEKYPLEQRGPSTDLKPPSPQQIAMAIEDHLAKSSRALKKTTRATVNKNRKSDC